MACLIHFGCRFGGHDRSVSGNSFCGPKSGFIGGRIEEVGTLRPLPSSSTASWVQALCTSFRPRTMGASAPKSCCGSFICGSVERVAGTCSCRFDFIRATAIFCLDSIQINRDFRDFAVHAPTCSLPTTPNSHLPFLPYLTRQVDREEEEESSRSSSRKRL